MSISISVEELQAIISPKFTEQVLYDIVKKQSGLISDIQVKKIKSDSELKKGVNFLSSICKFTIEATGKYSDGKELNVTIPVITKYLPKSVVCRETLRATDFFRNEIMFYEKVMSSFEKFQDSKNCRIFDNIPLILSSCTDGNNDYISMIDVSDQGYKTLDRATGLCYDYALAGLKIFAKFHSVSLALKDQQPEAFNKAASHLEETCFDEKYRKWFSGFQKQLFEVAQDSVSKELPSFYLEKLDALIASDMFAKMCKSCQDKGPFSVVTHGDVWICNLLVKLKEQQQIDDIIVIDFQLARWANLTNDLTAFLLACLDYNLLEKNWDILVSEYHKTLCESLEKLGSSKNLVTLEALKEAIKANCAYGIGMAMDALSFSGLEENEVSDLNTVEGNVESIENVWVVKPFKDQEKRRRIANMIKFVVDRNLI